MNYEEMLELEPFSIAQREKNELFLDTFKELTEYHRQHCSLYAKMLDTINFQTQEAKTIEEIPFLPVRLFKELELVSVPKEEIFKTMTSSGTSGQRVSKIFLDKATALNQQKTLIRIVSAFTGSKRMPMIIIDCPSVLKNREMFSARGAGILGFSIFGRKNIFALDDEMNLQTDKIIEFVEENRDKKILLFGFTFMIWKYFYQALLDRHLKLDLKNAILFHGGGWKKLIEQSVSPEEFNDAIRSVSSIDQIVNYYGMVEQTGCIYTECEEGHLHASTYSDVIIRRTADFEPCGIGERGLIQVLSPLPKSYPGHSLLTEDEGILLGEDDCKCGRKGRYFKILGRVKNAELRGCSDTYAAEH